MNSQATPPELIEQEMSMVRELLSTSEVSYNDSGWDSRIYTAGEFYFKFPRSEKIRGRYPQEIAALTVAREIGGVRVPEALWQSDSYFGYRAVPGDLLDKRLASLSDIDKTRIGTQIGTFLREFHRQTIPGVRHKSIEAEIEQLHEWYQPAIPVIRTAFTNAERQVLDKLVMTVWPQRMLDLGRIAALCHGDLHLSNMLFDDDSELGIIDFGDVAEYDHSKDFIDLGDSAIEEAAFQAYGDNDLLRQKIAVRRDAIRIITLTYHIKKQNDSGIEKYLEEIRQSL